MGHPSLRSRRATTPDQVLVDQAQAALRAGQLLPRAMVAELESRGFEVVRFDVRVQHPSDHGEPTASLSGEYVVTIRDYRGTVCQSRTQGTDHAVREALVVPRVGHISVKGQYVGTHGSVWVGVDDVNWRLHGRAGVAHRTAHEGAGEVTDGTALSRVELVVQPRPVTALSDTHTDTTGDDERSSHTEPTTSVEGMSSRTNTGTTEGAVGVTGEVEGPGIKASINPNASHSEQSSATITTTTGTTTPGDTTSQGAVRTTSETWHEPSHDLRIFSNPGDGRIHELAAADSHRERSVAVTDIQTSTRVDPGNPTSDASLAHREPAVSTAENTLGSLEPTVDAGAEVSSQQVHDLPPSNTTPAGGATASNNSDTAAADQVPAAHTKPEDDGEGGKDNEALTKGSRGHPAGRPHVTRRWLRPQQGSRETGSGDRTRQTTHRRQSTARNTGFDQSRTDDSQQRIDHHILVPHNHGMPTPTDPPPTESHVHDRDASPAPHPDTPSHRAAPPDGGHRPDADASAQGDGHIAKPTESGETPKPTDSETTDPPTDTQAQSALVHPEAQVTDLNETRSGDGNTVQPALSTFDTFNIDGLPPANQVDLGIATGFDTLEIDGLTPVNQVDLSMLTGLDPLDIDGLDQVNDHNDDTDAGNIDDEQTSDDEGASDSASTENPDDRQHA